MAGLLVLFKDETKVETVARTAGQVDRSLCRVVRGTLNMTRKQ